MINGGVTDVVDAVVVTLSIVVVNVDYNDVNFNVVVRLVVVLLLVVVVLLLMMLLVCVVVVNIM